MGTTIWYVERSTNPGNPFVRSMAQEPAGILLGHRSNLVNRTFLSFGFS